MSKTKKRISVSLIDVLIVLTVIACIAGTFIHYRIYEKNNRVSTDDTCLVSVMFSGIDPAFVDMVKEGDKVYLKENGELLGVVDDVKFDDAVASYTNEEGKLVSGKDTTKRDLTLVIEVKGDASKIQETGFLANGTKYVAAGMNIELYTADYSGEGLVFDVKQKNE